MKNSADQGGCYPQRPKAEGDNTLRAEFKVHLAPKFLFGRDETVQLSHKEFANFISMWYF